MDTRTRLRIQATQAQYHPKPQLNPYNPNLPTQLFTDASKEWGFGFILSQTDKQQTNIINCGSTVITKAQKNYSIYELELNALAWALQKNHFYINGAQREIEYFTDHKVLVNIENKDLAEVTNNRELRLLESITPYNIIVKHIPADKNTFADALSRLPSRNNTPPPDYIERYTPVQLKPHPKQAKIRVIRANSKTNTNSQQRHRTQKHNTSN